MSRRGSSFRIRRRINMGDGWYATESYTPLGWFIRSVIIGIWNIVKWLVKWSFLIGLFPITIFVFGMKKIQTKKGRIIFVAVYLAVFVAIYIIGSVSGG